jgi:hypothetical protein
MTVAGLNQLPDLELSERSLLDLESELSVAEGEYYRLMCVYPDGYGVRLIERRIEELRGEIMARGEMGV